MKFLKIVVLTIILASGSNSFAQFVKSPYSNNGLGDLLFQGLPHNFAMGEVGIGTSTPWHINLMNPALLTNNTFSTFQVGLSGDFRQYESDNISGSDNAASLRFLAMSFPIVASRWTSSLALLPVSTVNYNTFSQDSIDVGLSSVTQFQGEGGLTQLIWSNGIRVYKTLAFGVKASYIFGTIERDSRVQLLGDDFSSNYAISYVKQTSYSDVNLSLGVSYKWFFGEEKSLNFGGIYTVSNTLKGNESSYYERLRLTGSSLQQQTLSEDVTTEFTLPMSYGFGMSYELIGKLNLAFDLTNQRWKTANEGDANLTLRNTTNMSLGASWTPDFKSVNSYLKRATYRMGASAKQLPYLVNNTNINDFGINFGVSLPVNVYSSADLAFKFGQRGTTENNLIKENYFQVVIGATINDRWFIKRRYD